MKTAIQVTDTYTSEAEAIQAMEFQKIQEGYLGGRVLPPTASRDGWKMQSFHSWENAAPEWLPEGMKFVYVPQGVRAACNMEP